MNAVNLDDYAFSNDVPAALVEHVVCGWRHRCDGGSVEGLIWEIRHHHDSAHASTAGDNGSDPAAALRQLAADLIQDHASDAEDIEDFDLRDQLEVDDVLRHLAGADQDAALETLKELLSSAVVTVTWPGQEPRPEPEPAGEWEPGRWYRIRRPDGTLWMETSNRNEAQAEAEKTGWPLERLYANTRTEWRYDYQEPTL